MKKALICLLLSLCLACCQSNNHSIEVAKQKAIPPPPPPPPNINEYPDAIDKVEEAGFYAGFALAQVSAKRLKGKNEVRCGYKFNSFFYDEDKLAATKDANELLFEYSVFNNPMYFKNGVLVDKWVDDEWQEVVFFQLPLQKRFRYVDKELLKIKLCALVSSYGALESGDGRYHIQKGYLEGKQINDSVYDVRIEARYQAMMSDTSYWVPVWVDAHFKKRRSFSKPWEYQCPITKRVEK